MNNENLMFLRNMFEEQVKSDKSLEEVKLEWDEDHNCYNNPIAQHLFLGWKITQRSLVEHQQDKLNAKRHLYMRATTTAIRDGNAVLDCSPEQYDAAIDLAMSKDPNMDKGITEDTIFELIIKQKQEAEFRAKVKRLVNVAITASDVFNTGMMDEAIDDVQALLNNSI